METEEAAIKIKNTRKASSCRLVIRLKSWISLLCDQRSLKEPSPIYLSK